MPTTLKELLGKDYRDDLTTEELEQLILPIIENGQKEASKWKSSFDKKSSELSELQKARSQSLSEDEQAKEQRENEFNDLVERNKNLQRQLDISKFRANYIAQGYDEALASETAEALADNDYDKVFKNESKFIKAQQKQAEATRLADTPIPSGGEQDKGVSFEDFTKMKYTELMQLQETNPSLYEEYTARIKK